MKNIPLINGILRIVLGAGTPVALYLSEHGVSASDLTDWVIMGIPIIMAIWSGFTNTHASRVKATGEIPGVQVVVTEAAPESVQAVAKDTSEATKNVSMAKELPKNPPPLNIRRKS